MVVAALLLARHARRIKGDGDVAEPCEDLAGLLVVVLRLRAVADRHHYRRPRRRKHAGIGQEHGRIHIETRQRLEEHVFDDIMFAFMPRHFADVQRTAIRSESQRRHALAHCLPHTVAPCHPRAILESIAPARGCFIERCATAPHNVSRQHASQVKRRGNRAERELLRVGGPIGYRRSTCTSN